MYVLTGFNDEVIFVSEDLTYDVCNNPVVRNGSSAIIGSLVKQVDEGVTDVPEDVELRAYTYDGTEWKLSFEGSDVKERT